MKLNLQLSDLDEDSLDLTPLIDVLFLLLTFFILAASFMAPALEVELAKAKNLSSAPSQELSVTVSIDAEGQVYYEKKPISTDQLKGLIESFPAEASIIFNIDQRSPFESFMAVLDEAKSQGRQKFLINGRPDTENKTE